MLSKIFFFVSDCYNKKSKQKGTFYMITELNIYVTLLLAVILLAFAIRLGISLYK